MTRGLQVRRILTTTPLARQHEHRLSGRVTRRSKAIPWAAFDRSRYPAPALALACDAQSKLALGEYGAVDLFGHLASAMALNGVPFDLVAEAARVPADEIRHADVALRMAQLLADGEVTLNVDREGLRRRWKKDVDLENLDVLVLEVAAISETLSCALLSACLERATDATAHALFASIVADEVHHARLGWYYLAWRAPQWTRADQQRAADHAGEIIARTERRFWRGRDAAPSSREAAQALGVLESTGQRAAVRAVMENEIVPALDSLGLGASHAWRIRERGAARGVDEEPKSAPGEASRPLLRTVARGLPFRTLDRSLTDKDRRDVRAALRALLAWQRDLRTWAPCRRTPDATPFVALYARSRLFGCCGSEEGSPGERLARGFLRALSDARFGGIDPTDRCRIVAEVSYIRSIRRRAREELLAELEPGTHGIGVLRENGNPAVLLPSVARDGGLTAPQLLAALLQKAGAKDGDGLEFFLFDTDSTIYRMDERRTAPREARDAAAEWLSTLVQADGAVAFATDARTGARHPVGPMHHGRSAAVLQALAQHGGYPGHVARATRWLERDAREALAGRPPPGWPQDPTQVVGTLALAVLAGANLRAELIESVRSTQDLAMMPWHAAQAVAALGMDAPAPLWRACVEDLDREPWSPWTTLAARARGDAITLARAERALVDSIRDSAPYVGGVIRNRRIGIPEVALTAIAVEALAPSRGHAARAAVARARGFLLRWQITEERPAFADPANFGAFPASPIATVLRGDITAHALTALQTPA